MLKVFSIVCFSRRLYSRLPADNLCFLISGLRMLDKSDLQHVSLLGTLLSRAWRLGVVTKRSQVNSANFVKRVDDA